MQQNATERNWSNICATVFLNTGVCHVPNSDLLFTFNKSWPSSSIFYLGKVGGGVDIHVLPISKTFM